MSKENVRENYSDRKIKIMLATMIFCSVVYGFGMFKFIPMQDAITSHFGVNEGAYGYLNSATNWAVIILSVQMGFLIRKWPSKRSIIPVSYTHLQILHLKFQNRGFFPEEPELHPVHRNHNNIRLRLHTYLQWK